MFTRVVTVLRINTPKPTPLRGKRNPIRPKSNRDIVTGSPALHKFAAFCRFLQVFATPSPPPPAEESLREDVECAGNAAATALWLVALRRDLTRLNWSQWDSTGPENLLRSCQIRSRVAHGLIRVILTYSDLQPEWRSETRTLNHLSSVVLSRPP